MERVQIGPDRPSNLDSLAKRPAKPFYSDFGDNSFYESAYSTEVLFPPNKIPQKINSAIYPKRSEI